MSQHVVDVDDLTPGDKPQGGQTADPGVQSKARKAAARKLSKQIDEWTPWLEAAIELFKGLLTTANNIVKALGR